MRKERNQNKKTILNKMEFFSEMRGGEINDVAFCTTSQRKRI